MPHHPHHRQEHSNPDVLSKSAGRRRRAGHARARMGSRPPTFHPAPHTIPHPTQERSNPDVLSKSAGRRRRVAQDSGRSEAEVSAMMAQFTRMRAQMVTMGRMMALSTADGERCNAGAVQSHACTTVTIGRLVPHAAGACLQLGRTVAGAYG